MDGFFDWGMLATYAGATAATAIITQFIKGILAKIPTQIVSYAIALVLLLAATFFTGAFTFEAAALCIVNAVVVSLASNGAYDAVQRVKSTK